MRAGRRSRDDDRSTGTAARRRLTAVIVLLLLLCPPVSSCSDEGVPCIAAGGCAAGAAGRRSAGCRCHRCRIRRRQRKRSGHCTLAQRIPIGSGASRPTAIAMHRAVDRPLLRLDGQRVGCSSRGPLDDADCSASPRRHGSEGPELPLLRRPKVGRQRESRSRWAQPFHHLAQPQWRFRPRVSASDRAAGTSRRLGDFVASSGSWQNYFHT